MTLDPKRSGHIWEETEEEEEEDKGGGGKESTEGREKKWENCKLLLIND